MLSLLTYYFIVPLWYLLPALVGNVSALWAMKIPILTTPIDHGKTLFGKRIFGDHKTWRGILIGTLVGGLVAWSQQRLFLEGVILTLGNFIGDLFGAFIKRQMGLQSGSASLVLDALPSPICTLLFGALFYAMPLTLAQCLTMLASIIPLHIMANKLWYAIKLKSVPW